MKQTIAELRKRAEAESARQGGTAEPRRRGQRFAAAVWRNSRTELAAVERQIARENGRRGAASQRSPQLSAAHRRRARARSGAGGADARLRHAPADLPRPAGQEAGIGDRREPRAAADRRAFQGSRSGAVARAAVRPEPRRVSTRLAVLAGLAIGLIVAVMPRAVRPRAANARRRPRRARAARAGRRFLWCPPRVRGVGRAATVLSVGTAIVACAAALAWRLLK